MKARRAGVLVKKSDVKATVKKEFENCKDLVRRDTALQLTAIIFYTLAVNEGWGRVRLRRLMDQITGTADDMGGVGFCPAFNALDCVKFIRDKYGIDLEKEIMIEDKGVTK